MRKVLSSLIGKKRPFRRIWLELIGSVHNVMLIPALLKFTLCRHSAMESRALVPLFHSVATQEGTDKSDRVEWSAIILLMRAFAAFRNFS